MTPPETAAFAYAIASRLAYVLFVGIALRRQERGAAYTRRWGVEGGFQRFRRIASLVMVNDVFAFARNSTYNHDFYESGVLWATFEHDLVLYDHGPLQTGAWTCPTTGSDCRSLALPAVATRSYRGALAGGLGRNAKNAPFG